MANKSPRSEKTPLKKIVDEVNPPKSAKSKKPAVDDEDEVEDFDEEVTTPKKGAKKGKIAKEDDGVDEEEDLEEEIVDDWNKDVDGEVEEWIPTSMNLTSQAQKTENLR